MDAMLWLVLVFCFVAVAYGIYEHFEIANVHKPIGVSIDNRKVYLLFDDGDKVLRLEEAGTLPEGATSVIIGKTFKLEVKD